MADAMSHEADSCSEMALLKEEISRLRVDLAMHGGTVDRLNIQLRVLQDLLRRQVQQIEVA